MAEPRNAPLLTTEQALGRLLAAALPISGTDSLPTSAAHRRVLAADMVSPIDVPPVDRSAMDGYAVRAADLVAVDGASTSLPGAAGRLSDASHIAPRLPVSQRIPAGVDPAPLQPRSAARIFTGAGVPPGADTIVPQEQADANDAGVTFTELPAPGEWINRRGGDIAAGAVILRAGTRLDANSLGLAASVGLAQLPVVRRLKVALFSTGDELMQPGEPLRPGAIYNSNRFTLRALLEGLGCEVDDLGVAPDRLDATREILRRAARDSDLVLTCGGVSVGEEDHVKPAVEAEGRLDLWQIAVKPGKPLAFGTLRRSGHAADDSSPHASAPQPASAAPAGVARDTTTSAGAATPAIPAFFIGLPGNPVSAFVTFLIFVRPFLLRLQGVADVAPRTFALRADFSQPKADRRNEFLRARLNADGGLELFPNQSSGVLTSTVWADGLIDNPPGRRIEAGDMVRFMPFSQLLY